MTLVIGPITAKQRSRTQAALGVRARTRGGAPCALQQRMCKLATTERNPDARAPHTAFNFAMGLIHGLFFQAGMAFSEPLSVLPVFLSHFTKSQAMIGVFSALMSAGGVLPQLLVAQKLQSKSRRKPVLVAAIWTRATAWGILGGLTYFCISCNPTMVLAALIALFFVFSFAGGVAVVPFMDIWGKTLPATLRGRFFGHRQLWGGLMAVGAGYVVKRILADPVVSFPRNYGLLFLLSFGFIGVSYIALSSVREPEGKVNSNRESLRHFLRQSLDILRQDRNFALFVLTQFMAGFSALAAPFYVLYGQNEMGMPAAQIGILIQVQMIGGIASNLLWAELSDRSGNRLVIVLTTATAALIPVSALLAPGLGLPMLVATFGLIGFVASGTVIGFTNYLLEIAPAQLRPTYVALNGTLHTVTLGLPVVGGLVADRYSYRAAFWIVLVALAGAFLLATRLKRVRNPHSS